MREVSVVALFCLFIWKVLAEIANTVCARAVFHFLFRLLDNLLLHFRCHGDDEAGNGGSDRSSSLCHSGRHMLRIMRLVILHLGPLAEYEATPCQLDPVLQLCLELLHLRLLVVTYMLVNARQSISVVGVCVDRLCIEQVIDGAALR